MPLLLEILRLAFAWVSWIALFFPALCLAQESAVPEAARK